VSDYSAEQFNKAMPVGTEVIWIPSGDQPPIIHTKVVSKAENLPCYKYPMVILEASCGDWGGSWVPCHNVYKMSQNQFDEILKILDCREDV